MKADPFGNLIDWGPVMQLIEELTEAGRLDECQPGLARILGFKGNWRLREETLKRVQLLHNPSEQVIRQVIKIMGDNNTYFEMRILACASLGALLVRRMHPFSPPLQALLRKTLATQLAVPQPGSFQEALVTVEEKARLYLFGTDADQRRHVEFRSLDSVGNWSVT
ncbi:hypothetical protein [Desulfofustis limnaeus]|jgi:hypothetical protein|uniref:HEAT repeat domain-containing protein n=1 Tax=Desulfofustis limnaeus TaxID=2740163 RepID=A0ABN6M9U1_9BACT|nr:hypothetical protein [Desulfofustis limnaeus]MDX9894269.1 hypothetical protein [Desulfofustis sp.]BDD88809.1 hypothetical protein DPPLL_31740 [Desulfofustis limnaeus]